MFNDLRGKKILVLGAIQRICAIVKRLREMGIYTVVADYYEDSPAKKVANEAVLIDATNVDELVDYCLQNSIDGVLTAYIDPLLSSCFKVAEKAGLPCYMTSTMIEMSTNKIAFKHYCEAHNVSVPKTYQIDYKNYREQAKSLQFPVFLKPVDSSGSRGADVAHSYDDFIGKYEHALSFSKKKEVTVEDWLRGTEFILDYFLIDGEPYLMSMADRFSIKGRPAAVNHCNLMLLPSRHLPEYLEKADSIVKKMFRNLGFKNGVIFMQGYANENNITFYEMGCRLGGTWPYVDEYFTGINPIDMLAHHALTGQMLPEEKQHSINPSFNGKSAIIYFLSNKFEGRISHVIGVEEVRDMAETVCVLQYRFDGDEISMNRQTDVLLLAVHLVAPDFPRLKDAVNEVYSKIDYLDENGESILMDVIDIGQLEDLYGY